MSAYIVHDDTINLIASAARCWRVDVYTDAGRLSFATDADTMADLLYAENVKSVNYRYNESEPAPKFDFRYVDLDYASAAIEPEKLVLGSIRCLRYQSCEHPEYPTSAGAKVLDAIEAEAIRRLTDAAPWGWTRDWTEQRRAEVKARVAQQMARV